MELEVSYNENYCREGRAERRRGAPGCINGKGEAVGTDCVDTVIPHQPETSQSQIEY